MKRKIIYAVIGVFAIGVIGSVNADAQRGKRRGMRGGMAALELTDEQKEKMSDLRSAHQKAMVDLRAAHQKARIDLGEVRKQDNPSASDIQAKVDAVTAAQGKIMAREIQHNIDVKNLLTAEQKEKLGERRRGGRMGFRGRGGPGFRDGDGPRFRGRGGPGFRGRGPGFRDDDGPRFRGRGGPGFRGRRGGDRDQMKKESEAEEKSEHHSEESSEM
ncbi:MAG: periplasmic heavy metal sensor [Gemmatimonadetes bacterium]|nr:periplasmic heavy metal sensor [Gemmatimonadota bacterium]